MSPFLEFREVLVFSGIMIIMCMHIKFKPDQASLR